MNQSGVLIGRLVADHRIGTELPENEIGLGRDHRFVEALEHVRHFFAADAAVDDRDRRVWKE